MILIKRRQMIIPKDEKYIGTVNDANVEARTFRIDRYTETRSDLSAHTFKLLTEDEGNTKVTSYLDKMVTDEFIDLTWNITGAEVGTSGVLFAQIKAFDDSGLVRWNSFKGEFICLENLLESEGGGTLTDFERLEAKVNKAIEEINGSTIKTTRVEDGYLIIEFADGSTKRFYVKGDTGSVGSMTITMLEAGSDPTVTKTGSGEEVSFDLGIPFPYIDYSNLDNLPTIEGVELKGTITAAMLGLLKTTDIKAWAKADTKPTYTAAEVGALPASTYIPPEYNDAEIRQMIAGKQPAGDYALKSEVPAPYNDTELRGLIAGKQDAGNYALSSQIPTNLNQLTNGPGYITGAALNGYATEDYVDQAIENAGGMGGGGTTTIEGIIKTTDSTAATDDNVYSALKTNVLLNEKVGFREDSYIGAVIPSGSPGTGGSITSSTVEGWGFAKSEDIPTDDHINSLIQTALGVIENGTY